MGHLYFSAGPQTGQTVPLKGTLTIGRSPGNLICLPDSRASRKHARIFEKGSSWWIEDLGSANGTYIGTQRLSPNTPANLPGNSDVTICSSTFRIVLDESESTLEKTAPQMAGVITGEEQSKPEVSLTMDASRNLMEISESEKKSEKGLNDAIRRLQAMVQVSVDLGGVSARHEILEKVMERIFDVFPVADRAFVLLRHPHTGEMLPAAGRKRKAEESADETFAISRTIIKAVTQNRQSMLSSDAMTDQRFGAQQSIANLQIRSMMCAPFLCKDELIGVISVDSMSCLQAFDENDLAMLTGIASQAAIAIKNSDLYERVEEEAEKRTLLSRYMSPDIVSGVLDGTVPLELGGKKAHGTVFFCDILGFTRLSETMEAENVIDRLNRCFQLTTNVITKRKGTVHKFGGDAIMAFWNVMFDDPEHEKNALLAGIDMQKAIWLFDMEMQKEGNPPIYLGVGCNTGSFAAGNIGGEGVMEYTVIGDNVNLAQRIESKAGRWQVLISESTFGTIRSDISAVALPQVLLKGKSQPINIYSIRAVRESDHCMRMAIPARILDAKRKPAGSAMIVGMENNELLVQTGMDIDMQDSASLRVFTKDTRANPVMILELNLPEFSSARHIIGIVQSVETETFPTEHKLVHLRNLQASDDTLTILQPGGLLNSEKTWDQMPRN